MRLKVFNKLLLDKGIRNPNKNLRYMLALLQKNSGMVSFFGGGASPNGFGEDRSRVCVSNRCINGPFIFFLRRTDFEMDYFGTGIM